MVTGVTYRIFAEISCLFRRKSKSSRSTHAQLPHAFCRGASCSSLFSRTSGGRSGLRGQRRLCRSGGATRPGGFSATLQALFGLAGQQVCAGEGNLTATDRRRDRARALKNAAHAQARPRDLAVQHNIRKGGRTVMPLRMRLNLSRSNVEVSDFAASSLASNANPI